MDSLKSHIKSKGVSSNVTVNQRKLIDTMLARYAGDYATFRELIQNADDAHSKTFTFSFKDVQKLGGSEIKMSEIQVTNDGKIFRNQDWDRLRSYTIR